MGELGVGQPEVLRSWDRFTLPEHSGDKKAHDWLVDQLVDLLVVENFVLTVSPQPKSSHIMFLQRSVKINGFRHGRILR